MTIGIPKTNNNNNNNNNKSNTTARILATNIPVGVCYLPATPSHPPLRIFYPAAASDSSGRRPVTWFQEEKAGGVVPFLLGYLHTIGLIDGHSWATKWIVRPWVWMISRCLPMTWLRIPGVLERSPLLTPINPNQKKFPLIVFSHGLTGTGQENAVLCASWAQQGRIVVGVHHTDGSSCRVAMADGSVKFYQHAPPLDKNYDANFRPNQVRQRAREVLQARDFLLKAIDENTISGSDTKTDDDDKDSLLQEIQQAIDPTRIVVAGYSYGAATIAQVIVDELKQQQQQQQQTRQDYNHNDNDQATEEKKSDDDSTNDDESRDFHQHNATRRRTTTTSEAISLQPPPFQAAMFLDGWFHIDIQHSAGIEFDFPPDVFAYLDDKEKNETTRKSSSSSSTYTTTTSSTVWPIPSLFIDSEQFQGYTKLFAATQRLARVATTSSSTNHHARANQKNRDDDHQQDIESLTVLPGTGHQNFCDVIFWLPLGLLKRLMMGAVGNADPLLAYQQILDRTQAFLNEYVDHKNKMDNDNDDDDIRRPTVVVDGC